MLILCSFQDNLRSVFWPSESLLITWYSAHLHLTLNPSNLRFNNASPPIIRLWTLGTFTFFSSGFIGEIVPVSLLLRQSLEVNAIGIHFIVRFFCQPPQHEVCEKIYFCDNFWNAVCGYMTKFAPKCFLPSQKPLQHNLIKHCQTSCLVAIDIDLWWTKVKLSFLLYLPNISWIFRNGR